MKHIKNNAGFSILELLFFVVISSALIVIPFRILQGRNQDVQFVDAARTIQAIMQREFNNTVNGVNPGNPSCRWLDPPGKFDFSADEDENDGSCIFLGSVTEFGQIVDTVPGDKARQEINVYPIVARNMQLNDDTRAELEACKSALGGISESRKNLHCIEPTRKLDKDGNVEVDTTTIPWGVEITKTGHADNNGLAFFRDPELSRVFPVGYRDGFTDYEDNDVFTVTGDDSLVRVDAEYSGYVCFGVPGDEATAYLGVGSGSRQEVIELEFDQMWRNSSGDLFNPCEV